MTMRVTVKNEDAARTAAVLEQEWSIPPAGSLPEREHKHRLSPGESRDFWIHAAKTLQISEEV